jgi:hypothetical protein
MVEHLAAGCPTASSDIPPRANQYFSAELKSVNPRSNDGQILSLFLSFIMLQ